MAAGPLPSSPRLLSVWLDVSCPPSVCVFEHLVPSLWLFGKVVKEPLACDASLEEVRRCGLALRLASPALILACQHSVANVPYAAATICPRCDGQIVFS